MLLPGNRLRHKTQSKKSRSRRPGLSQGREGYLPQATYGTHCSDPNFKDAVRRFLDEERQHVKTTSPTSNIVLRSALIRTLKNSELLRSSLEINALQFPRVILSRSKFLGPIRMSCFSNSGSDSRLGSANSKTTVITNSILEGSLGIDNILSNAPGESIQGP